MKRLLWSIFLGLLVLTACGRGKTAAQEPEYENTITAADGSELVGWQIERSEALTNETVGSYYAELQQQTEAELETEWSAWAESDRKFSGGNFRPYFYNENDQVMREDEKLISVLRQINVYTGGAHGDAVIACETFDAASGRVLQLAELFTEGADWQNALLREITAVISENPDTFYANAADCAAELLPETPFYLTDQVLAVCFQTYELAPFAVGNPVFEIELASLREILNPQWFA